MLISSPRHPEPPASAATWPPAGARRRQLLLLALWVLLLGPLIAPLFQASGLPLLAWSGLLARDLLSAYVCPTPAKSYLLLGLPMAVCARCWGATIGLWGAYLLSKRERTASSVPHFLLLMFCALLAFALWPLEIVGEARGWWVAPYWLLLLNGAQAGLLGGLALAALRHLVPRVQRAATQRRSPN
jgi:hypothetical protein